MHSPPVSSPVMFPMEYSNFTALNCPSPALLLHTHTEGKERERRQTNSPLQHSGLLLSLVVKLLQMFGDGFQATVSSRKRASHTGLNKARKTQ